jgi:hypothetical protein
LPAVRLNSSSPIDYVKAPSVVKCVELRDG